LHFGDIQTDRLTDNQTDKQMDRPNALSRFRCRERRLNNHTWRKRWWQTLANNDGGCTCCQSDVEPPMPLCDVCPSVRHVHVFCRGE